MTQPTFEFDEQIFTPMHEYGDCTQCAGTGDCPWCYGKPKGYCRHCCGSRHCDRCNGTGNEPHASKPHYKGRKR